jgi:hypothetical protein
MYFETKCLDICCFPDRDLIVNISKDRNKQTSTQANKRTKKTNKRGQKTNGNLVHIYFLLKCNLLSSHPSSSLNASAAYGHHQVLPTLLKLLHSMSILRVECERDIS